VVLIAFTVWTTARRPSSASTNSSGPSR